MHENETLRELVETYHQLLLARGNTTKHADDTRRQIMRTLDLGHIDRFERLTETTVRIAIHRMPSISAATRNHYLRAVKGFSRWTAAETRRGHHPLAGLTLLNEQTDRRHERRALTLQEQRDLIASTEHAPTQAGLAGTERALIWELLLQSGIRSGELRQIRGRDIERHAAGTVSIRVRATISKNRKEKLQPIPADLGRRLLEHAAARGRMQPLFDLPSPPHMVRMLRTDLLRAGIPYQTAEGFADVHAFRHTYGTEITAVCGNPKDAQELMRHSTISLTFNLYAHRSNPQLQKPVSKLPPLRSDASGTN